MRTRSPFRAKLQARRIFSPLQIDVVKNPRRFKQITSSKPLRIGYETIPPFQTNFLNPNRRATLHSGKKINRGPNAQSDASGLRMGRNPVCKNFLLWSSDRDENQGSLRLDNKIHTSTDLEFRPYKSHLRSVRYNAEARIFVSQPSASRVRRPNDCNREAVLCGARDKIGGKITARNNWQIKATDLGQAAQHPAIAKHPPSPFVERLQYNRVFKQPNHVVDVWRCNVLEPFIRRCENMTSSFFD
jgi:hypothetical protein